MKNVLIVPVILTVVAIALLMNVTAHADTTSDLAKADAIVAAADLVGTESFSHRGNEIREKRTEVAKTKVLAYRVKNETEAKERRAASDEADWTNKVLSTIEANDGLYEDVIVANPDEDKN